MDIELVINELAKESTAPDKETPDWLKSDIRRGIKWGLSNAQTIWTPITGEASLPTDDEALCLFVWFFESTNTPSTHSLFCQWKYLRLLSDYEDISSKYTHYTILQPPVK